MATKEKDDISAPVAILVMFLAFAFAAAGIGGGSGRGSGGQTGSDDPCEGKSPDTVVRSWNVDGRTVYLRCGDSDSEGWRHIRDRRVKEDDDIDDVLDCISRIIGEGTYRAGYRGPNWGTPRDVYELRLAGQRKTTPARVLVDMGTNNIRTVFPNTRDWARCARGALA